MTRKRLIPRSVLVGALVFALGDPLVQGQEPDGGGLADDAGWPDAGSLVADAGNDSRDATAEPAPTTRAIPPETVHPGAAVRTPRASAPVEPAADPSPIPPPGLVPQPIQIVSDRTFVDDVLPIWDHGERWTAWRLLALLVLTAFLTWLVRKLREWLPRTGLLPRVVRIAHIGLRLWVFAVGVALAAVWLEPTIGTAFPWVLLAMAISIGASLWLVVPDVVAFIVLMFERHLRRGTWVSAGDHTGIVERRGLRALWLRDGMGHRIALPNRSLLATPVLSRTEQGLFHEIPLRLPVGPGARQTRQAIKDAVLTSPWVRPDTEALIRRNPDEPNLWHVRTRLLEPGLGGRVEGDLLDRIEELLSRNPDADDDWD